MSLPNYIANPVGIDFEIQRVQKYIQSRNVFELVYGKASTIYNEKEKSVCVYFRNGEYKDVLQNDTYISQIFFYFDGESTINDFIDSVTVNVLCFANLQKMFPNIEHRSEEELIILLRDYVKKASLDTWKLEKVIRGEKAFQEIGIEVEDYENLHPRFIFSLNYNISINNLNNC